MGQVVQSTVLVEQQGAASAGGQGVKGEAIGPSSPVQPLCFDLSQSKRRAGS